MKKILMISLSLLVSSCGSLSPLNLKKAIQSCSTNEKGGVDCAYGDITITTGKITSRVKVVK